MDQEISFPSSLPRSAKKIVLKPGFVLFLPRGYWHETKILETSLSITPTVFTKTWLDILNETLWAKLIETSEWREPAANLTGTGAPLKKARNKPCSLLDSLVKELPFFKIEKIPCDQQVVIDLTENAPTR